MAPPADLRSWIALLEREGELVRVSAEVDPHLEVTEIVDRTVKAGGPALLFENPKSSHSLLINQFGTERRMCLALGVERLDDIAGRLEVAVALGLDPVTTYTASAPLPKHIDELMLAGFLRSEPVELVCAKTVNLDVPANAEIVLEGYVQQGEEVDEGPFGDHTGYYTPAEPF